MPDKEKILSAIKAGGKPPIQLKHVRLPSQIQMKWELSGTVRLHWLPQYLIVNMQDDKASVEAWACIIKRWIPSVEEVVVSWSPPDDPKSLHYQRFLFRVQQFSGLFAWFKIDSACKGLISSLLYGKPGNKYLLNEPGKRLNPEKKLSVLVSSSESALEAFIFNYPDELKSQSDLNFLDRQLPVGVFMNNVKKERQVFTSGKSAVDLWGITKSNNLCLFELKKKDNIGAGIISELLFYCFVFSEVQNRSIQITSDEIAKVMNTNGIRAFFLVPRIHPLIDEGVLKLLNIGLKRKDIILDAIKISNAPDGTLNYQKYWQ